MFVLANGELVRMPAETPGRASSCCIPPGYRPGDIDGREHQNGMSALTAVPQTNPPITKEET